MHKLIDKLLILFHLVYNRQGDASMSFLGSTSTRYLVLSWMFRNNWIASLDNGDTLNTTPVFKSFIGVEIPPDTTQVNIHYRPAKRIVLVFFVTPKVSKMGAKSE